MRIRGRILGTDCVSELTISEGKIQEILPDSASEEALGAEDCWIAPGFVDIHVNGWCGHDLNSPEVTPSDVSDVVTMLREYGVTTFLPTVTTQSGENLCRSLRAIRQAMEESGEVAAACPWIHLEGPYISPDDGPRGAHPLEHVRPPDPEEFKILQEAAGGKIKMVTLAPEAEGAIPFIEELARAQILPAIGHANAAVKDIHAAVQAGARISTHLGNGAHARMDRHPNYIWEQLASDELHATLIADGHHLPPSVVKCMVRCKGVARCILITDATGLAGRPPGLYKNGGTAGVELTEAGAARLAGTPYLAGAVMPLTRCIENAVRFAGVSLNEALEMATLNPARILGMEHRVGSIETGKDANMVLLKWNPAKLEMEIAYTIASGCIVWQR